MLRKIVSDSDQLILFVGVGNVLHSDDGVGVYISERIKDRDHIRVIKAEVSIENYIGKINTINPDLLIIIDSVFFGREPGYCEMTPVEKLLNYTTNTHNISLKQVAVMFNCRVYVLGIQPNTVEFGDVITPVILEKADELIEIINSK